MIENKINKYLNEIETGPVFFSFDNFTPADIKKISYQEVDCCSNCSFSRKPTSKDLSCTSEQMAKYITTFVVAEDVYENFATKDTMVCKFHKRR